MVHMNKKSDYNLTLAQSNTVQNEFKVRDMNNFSI